MIADGFIRQLYRHIAEPRTNLKRQSIQNEKLVQDISKAETKLNEILKGEEKKLFLAYCDAHSELSSLMEQEIFITGFRLGAQFSLDTFCSEDTPFENHYLQLREINSLRHACGVPPPSKREAISGSLPEGS